MPIPRSGHRDVRGRAHLGENAQHGAASDGNLNPEFDAQGVGPVLIESLAHGSDDAANSLGKFWQLEDFNVGLWPLSQPNIRRTGGITTDGRLGLYSHIHQVTARQPDLNDLRRAAAPPLRRSCSSNVRRRFRGVKIPFRF